MNRLVVGALLLLLVAACGRDQDPTLSVGASSSSSSSSSSSPTTARPRASVPPPDEGACTGAEPASGEDLTLNVAHGDLVGGSPVEWVLSLTNGGDEAIELVFGSGQDGDVALTKEQEPVYRWSEGLMFTQAVRCQVLEPGATAEYRLRDPAFDVPPGEYQLRAGVAATPKPFDVAMQVTVG